LTGEQRKAVGEDIKTVEFNWPIGMPTVRKIEPDLWEVRTRFQDGIARVFFTVTSGRMLLLHGIKKKSQKTPQEDLVTARKRLRQAKGESK
jgi:phage-related protein